MRPGRSPRDHGARRTESAKPAEPSAKPAEPSAKPPEPSARPVEEAVESPGRRVLGGPRLGLLSGSVGGSPFSLLGDPAGSFGRPHRQPLHRWTGDEGSGTTEEGHGGGAASKVGHPCAARIPPHAEGIKQDFDDQHRSGSHGLMLNRAASLPPGAPLHGAWYASARRTWPGITAARPPLVHHRARCNRIPPRKRGNCHDGCPVGHAVADRISGVRIRSAVARATRSRSDAIHTDQIGNTRGSG